MAEYNLEYLAQNSIDTYADAREIIRDLEKELLILGKKIRKVMKDMAASLTGKLYSHLKGIGTMLTDAFRVDSMEDYTQAAAMYGAQLAGTLYQLQLSFGLLKLAVIQAAAPIVQVLLPVVQLAVQALTGLAQSIGYVLRMLISGTAQTQSYASGFQTATSSAKKLKRTLAGFDQINRLGDHSSGGGGAGGIFDAGSLKPLGGAWKKLADKLLELLEPLRKIDLTPAAESLERLKAALEPITRALFAGLEWAWYNIFVPLAEWAVEELLPVFLDTLTVALETLGRVVEELKPHFTWLWENCLKPWAEWKANQIIQDLQGLQNELSGFSGWITASKNPVEQFLENGKKLIETLGSMTQTSMGLSEMADSAGGAVAELLARLLLADSPLQNMSSAMGILSGSVSGLAGAFSQVTESAGGTWNIIGKLTEKGWAELKNKLLDPTYNGLKSTANGAIGVLNGLLSGATGGVNFLTRALNKLSFTIPDWIPFVGGKSFYFSAKTLQAPKIPFLAKGAVLPANKPFMAVVGDQRHGTNVEAPLATIQEAVAQVMADYSAGNMAGHQATVAVLQELLAAVLGICVGDETVAAASDRYAGKLAVIRGGYL